MDIRERRGKLTHLVLCGALAVLSCTAAAQEEKAAPPQGKAGGEQQVDRIMDTGVQRNEEARESQQRIDEIAESADKLLAEYKRELKVIEGLEVYNALLERQIDDQNRQLSELRQSIEEVAVIQRQITPLMLRMLEGLAEFIELDVPFLLEERRGRVERLRSVMASSDVTTAEKFRAVLEAFQIENDYGRTIEAYKGSLQLGGSERQVDFLRIGRIALLYQSHGGEYNGYWDKEKRAWQPVDDPAFRNQVARGLQIARKQVAPDLLMVPVPAPEGAK
jgi:Spy/CpxP family protein refolding chaperone